MHDDGNEEGAGALVGNGVDDANDRTGRHHADAVRMGQGKDGAAGQHAQPDQIRFAPEPGVQQPPKVQLFLNGHHDAHAQQRA